MSVWTLLARLLALIVNELIREYGVRGAFIRTALGIGVHLALWRTAEAAVTVFINADMSPFHLSLELAQFQATRTAITSGDTLQADNEPFLRLRELFLASGTIFLSFIESFTLRFAKSQFASRQFPNASLMTTKTLFRPIKAKPTRFSALISSEIVKMHFEFRQFNRARTAHTRF